MLKMGTSAAGIVPLLHTVFFVARKPFNQIINIFKKAHHPAGRLLKARCIRRSSILCIENIHSIFAQQSLICEGRELMACASLEKSDTVARTLGAMIGLLQMCLLSRNRTKLALSSGCLGDATSHKIRKTVGYLKEYLHGYRFRI